MSRTPARKPTKAPFGAFESTYLDAEFRKYDEHELRMTNMNYKGYIGQFKVDTETGLIRGMVINTRDVITFHGKTVEEAQKAFCDSIDDYLEFCRSLGQAPEKPYSGKVLIRMNPQLQQKLHVLASSQGLSVNKFITRRLAAVARKAYSSARSPVQPAGRMSTPVAAVARPGRTHTKSSAPPRSAAPRPAGKPVAGARPVKRRKTKVQS